jgi:hypothetical protein
MVQAAPGIKLLAAGYVDCSENSGEFMDFGIIYKSGKLTVYSSDWEGYDDMTQDEDGEWEESGEMGREDKFMEMQDMDIDDIKEAMRTVISDIKEKKWLSKEVIEID